MIDVGRVRDDPEIKIVVLGEIVFRAEPAQLLHERAPDRREVTNVIVGEKKIGRPIGFEKGRVEADLGQFVFVGINEIGVGMRLEEFRGPIKRVRLEQVVVVEEADPFAGGGLDAEIGSGRNSPWRFESEEMDTPIGSLQAGEHVEGFLFGRPVVDQHQLPIFVGLLPNGIDRLLEPARRRVMDRRDHADRWARWKRRGILPASAARSAGDARCRWSQR